MSIFSKRLKALREAHHMSQKELAEKLNVSKKTISAYETGRAQPPMYVISLLADLFHTSVDYLLGKTDDPRPMRWAIGTQLYTEEGFVEIPVYNGARAGTQGSYPDGSTIIEYVKIPRNINGVFGVKVFGDSMEPEIKHGDIVVVNPNTTIVSGDRVVVVLGEPYFVEPAAVVKIYREQHGVKYLQSLNEAYGPIVLTDNASVHFVGKVVGLVRKY